MTILKKTRLVPFVFTHISFTQSIPTSIPAISIKIHFLYKNKSPTIFKWNFFLFAIKFLAQQNLILKSKSIWLLNNSIHMNHLLDRKKREVSFFNLIGSYRRRFYLVVWYQMVLLMDAKSEKEFRTLSVYFMLDWFWPCTSLHCRRGLMAI